MWFGWLADKCGAKLVGAAYFAMMDIGLLCFGYVYSGVAWVLVPFLIFSGAGNGGSSVLRPSIVREFFGRTTFGTIYGAISGLAMLGNIIGPPLAG